MLLPKVICTLLLLIPTILHAISLQVEIKGTSVELTNSIAADLTLSQASTEPKLTEQRIQNLYHLSKEQIDATLQAKGYYNSEIHSDLKQYAGTTPDNDKWVATFIINKGMPTLIKNIYVKLEGSGFNNESLNKNLTTPKLKIGKIISHADYEDTKEELLANLSANGYLQAEFTQSVIEVDRAEHTAAIKFTINTGPQYKFGKITFVDEYYKPEFLTKFASFKPGDPYSLDKLLEFQNNLESVDLFSKVRFDPLNDLEDPNNQVVPIQVRLHEKPKNRYTGSVGYGTDTGFRGSLGWLHRLRNTDGHKIAANVYVSQRRSTARANYIIPGSRPATDKYIIGALGQIEKFEEVFSRKAEVSGSKVMKRGKFESMYGLWYFTETFRIVYALPTLNRKYLLPTVRWTWTDAKQTINYEYGTRLELNLRAGAQCLFSDNSVAQVEIGAKEILPLTSLSRLLLRLNLGAVADKEFESLPPSLRFFTGGDDTVRGFAYNSLGPLAVPSDLNSVIGGRYLFVISSEFEHKLYQQLSGVLFVDAGNASLSTNIPLAVGAGFGIRYRTPVGNLRFDLAKPLNTVVNKHWRIHINFGMDL